MIGRRLTRWFALLPGAALLSGCAAPGDRTVPSQSSPATAARTHELPPEKTADLCLATAAELDKQGFEAEAIPQYEKARQLAPLRAAWVARRLAVLYDRQGAPDRALVEYQLALQQQPRDADLLNDFGFFHCRRGEPAEAERWLRQALAVNAHHQQATINLAQLVGRQGRYEECLRLFGQVLTPAQAQYNLAVLQAKAGHDAEAQTCLQQAIQLDPTFTQARTLLVRFQTPLPAQAQGEAPNIANQSTLAPVTEKQSPLTEAAEKKDVQPIVQVKMIENNSTSVALPPITRSAH